MFRDEIKKEDGTVCDKFFIGYIIYRYNLCGIAPSPLQVHSVFMEYRELDQLIYDKLVATLADEYYIMRDFQWDAQERKWYTQFRTYKSVIPLYDKLLEVCDDDQLVELSNRDLR